MSGATGHVSGTLSLLDQRIVAAVPPGGNWRDLPEDFPSKRVTQIREGARSGGGSRSTYYGRLRWDRPAYTINTFLTRPGNGCFIHPRAPRLITLREAARLQTFPDRFQFAGPMRARAMQIGNAVPPLLAYHLGRMIPPGPVADLFCGAGGMSLGMELAGHDVVAAVDHDRHAIAAAKGNAVDPSTVEQSDLADADTLRALAASIRDRAPDGLAALVGGPPCQGFSTAGPCRIDDPRNMLVRTFLDAVRMTDPAVVIMENVPALMWRGAAFLDELTGALHDLGYQPEVALLHAEAYGVPQLRRRLIVLATRDEAPRWPAPINALREPSFLKHQPGANRNGLPASPVVRHAISDLPDREADGLDALVQLGEPKSDLQRWLRGEVTIDALVPEVLAVSGPPGA